MDLNELLHQVSEDAEDELLIALAAVAERQIPSDERLPALDYISDVCNSAQLLDVRLRIREVIWWDDNHLDDLGKRAAIDAANGCVAVVDAPTEAELLLRAWTTAHNAWRQITAMGPDARGVAQCLLPTWTHPVTELAPTIEAILSATSDDDRVGAS